MRIGFISQWYDPEGGSATIPGAIARALHKRGLDVQVVTGYPNYPTGRIYQGYSQRLHSFESRGGVGIHRVPIYPDHSDSGIQRLLSYGSFAASSATLGLASVGRCDAYFVYATPVSVGLGPLVRRPIRKTPTVTYIPDLWPDTLTDSGLLPKGRSGELLAKVASAFTNRAYRGSDALVCTSEGMRTALVSRGIPEERISAVYNWVDESKFFPHSRSPALAATLGLTGKFVVMYAGNLGPLQDLNTILDAAGALIRRPDIAFVFVGSGILESQLKARVVSEGLTNVTFVPLAAPEEMPDLIALSDVQLVSLIDRPIFRITIPSKLQFSFASGRPVISSITGEASALVEISGAGRAISPADPGAMVAAVVELADMSAGQLANLGVRARDFYLGQFSEAVGSAALMQTLNKITAG